MDMLNGKNAIVTGSTSGIGLGIARALAAEGANVMLNGFGEAAAIEALRREIAQASGTKIGFNGADLMKPEGVAALIAACEAELGPVDIIVNNAGIQHTAKIEEFPTDRWDAILALNLSAVFHGMRLTVAGMKARGFGRIVNIASVHGLVASKEKAAYVAAKHAVVGLTKVVALETAGTGVTCNAICPGWVLTPLVQKQIDAIAAKEGISNDAASAKLLSEKQPSGRFVQPEELAAAAAFLCSPAAAQMTGAQLVIDGGWTAQ
jgi:3-hydroxybutyrate dehydrogenase